MIGEKLKKKQTREPFRWPMNILRGPSSTRLNYAYSLPASKLLEYMNLNGIKFSRRKPTLFNYKDYFVAWWFY